MFACRLIISVRNPCLDCYVTLPTLPGTVRRCSPSAYDSSAAPTLLYRRSNPPRGDIAGVPFALRNSCIAAASDRPVTLQVNVRRVVVDVVVTDSNGAPVRGLTEKDFRVLEDGKPEPVRTFDPHTDETQPALPAPNCRPTPSPTSPPRRKAAR